MDTVLVENGNLFGMHVAAVDGDIGVTGLAAMLDAVEALKACDMLIDCIFLLLLPEQMATQAARTRILTAVEPPELLARMRDAIAITRRLTDLARAKGMPVIYTTIVYHHGELSGLAWLSKAGGRRQDR